MKYFNLLIISLFLSVTAQAEEIGTSNMTEPPGIKHRADTNQDGVVDQGEFMAAAQQRFTNMDQNGDGVINRQEARRAMMQRRAKMRARIRAMRRRQAQ